MKSYRGSTFSCSEGGKMGRAHGGFWHVVNPCDKASDIHRDGGDTLWQRGFG